MFGMPNFSLNDGRHGTVSDEWQAFGSVLDIVMVVNPVRSPSQMRTIERHVGLLKSGIQKIQGADSTSSFGEIVRGAASARNHTMVMCSGMTPRAIDVW